MVSLLSELHEASVDLNFSWISVLSSSTLSQTPVVVVGAGVVVASGHAAGTVLHFTGQISAKLGVEQNEIAALSHNTSTSLHMGTPVVVVVVVGASVVGASVIVISNVVGASVVASGAMDVVVTNTGGRVPHELHDTGHSLLTLETSQGACPFWIV